MSKDRINLLGLTYDSLVDFFQSLGEPNFRASQLMKWIHQRGIIDFDKMTDFSVNLRSHLYEIAEIRPPIVEECLTSSEGTKKYLIKLD